MMDYTIEGDPKVYHEWMPVTDDRAVLEDVAQFVRRLPDFEGHTLCRAKCSGEMHFTNRRALPHTRERRKVIVNCSIKEYNVPVLARKDFGVFLDALFPSVAPLLIEVGDDDMYRRPVLRDFYAYFRDAIVDPERTYPQLQATLERLLDLAHLPVCHT